MTRDIGTSDSAAAVNTGNLLATFEGGNNPSTQDPIPQSIQDVHDAANAAEKARRVSGDDLQSVTVATLASFDAALAAQANADTALELVFSDDVTKDGTLYQDGDVVYVPPRSSDIERRFSLIRSALSRSIQSVVAISPAVIDKNDIPNTFRVDFVSRLGAFPTPTQVRVTLAGEAGAAVAFNQNSRHHIVDVLATAALRTAIGNLATGAVTILSVELLNAADNVVGSAEPRRLQVVESGGGADSTARAYAAEMAVWPPNVAQHSDVQRNFQSTLAGLDPTLATEAGSTGTRFANTFRILTRNADDAVVQLHTQGWSFTEDNRQTIPWEVDATEFNRLGTQAATTGLEVWGEFRAVYGGGVDELRGRTNAFFIDFGAEAEWPTTRGEAIQAIADASDIGYATIATTAELDLFLAAQAASAKPRLALFTAAIANHRYQGGAAFNLVENQVRYFKPKSVIGVNFFVLPEPGTGSGSPSSGTGRILEIDPTGNPARTVTLPADYETYDLLLISWGEGEITLDTRDLSGKADEIYHGGSSARFTWARGARTLVVQEDAITQATLLSVSPEGQTEQEVRAAISDALPPFADIRLLPGALPGSEMPSDFYVELSDKLVSREIDGLALTISGQTFNPHASTPLASFDTETQALVRFDISASATQITNALDANSREIAVDLVFSFTEGADYRRRITLPVNNPNAPRLVPESLDNIPFNAALTLDWLVGDMRSITLTANIVFTFSNIQVGRPLVLEIKQDATGGKTITWPASVEWAGGAAEGPSSGGGDVDIYTLLPLAKNRVIATALLDVS